MKTEYTFIGRNGELHKLLKYKENMYSISTNYSIGITSGRDNEIIAIDLSGGPLLITNHEVDYGVIIESFTIDNDSKEIFVTLKEN